MNKDDYIELLKKEDYESLANIDFVSDLLSTNYNGKNLVEYLLEKGIHSKKMDDYVVHQLDFAKLYLKYNIVKPLLKCSLKVLLSNYNNDDLFIDLVLDKINDNEKLELYHNIKVISYSDFHEKESEVVSVYLRHGIILPIVFASTHLKEDVHYELLEEDKNLLNEFENLFKNNHENSVLALIVNELSRGLLNNHDRVVNDIKKMIDLKKENPEFCFIDSKNRGGESYDKATKIFKTSPTEPVMFNHELSHLLYESYDNLDESVFNDYENLRLQIDREENYSKIKEYLEKIHKEHEMMKAKFQKVYFDTIDEKYGSFDNYIELVCRDMLNNIPEMLELWNHEKGTMKFYPVFEFNVRDVVMEFLTIEREEFVRINTRKYFAPDLMIENMLDAILLGKIFDNDLGINCLSGHGSFYFSNKKRSFDECLANYDAIKKSIKGDKLILDLESLIGYDLINFLDSYIEKNREGKYEHR